MILINLLEKAVKLSPKDKSLILIIYDKVEETLEKVVLQLQENELNK
jgi:hypothetical protein